MLLHGTGRTVDGLRVIRALGDMASS